MLGKWGTASAWVMVVLCVLGLTTQMWGSLQFWIALLSPTGYTTLRAWRVNFLSAVFNLLIAVIAAIILIATYGDLIGYILSIGGFLCAGGAMTLVWYFKNIWYAYDPEGDLAANPDWSLFAIIDEETDETDTTATSADDTTIATL